MRAYFTLKWHVLLTKANNMYKTFTHQTLLYTALGLVTKLHYKKTAN